ncbi:MAG: PAS domain S-box protein [bacterium]|nr:PAS domain S-box protein [bacterium]
MGRLKTLRLPGRAQRLRMLLVALLLASASVLVVQSYWLYLLYNETGSWQGVWEQGWRSGHVVTELLARGMFQVFVLGLGWSFYVRIRNTELANLRLRRSEQKYRSIINHAGEAIFLIDEQGRVQEWNKLAESLFRVPRRNALGRSVDELDLGLQRDRTITLEQVFGDVRRTGHSLTYELQQGEASDAPRTLSLTVSGIRPDAGPLDDDTGSFVVIARDITSEKQLETRMGETEKLAGIGQLAAGIAHQLNTPLGSILLSAQMLEDTVKDEDDADDIRRIIRQTEQCRGIIKGLLNFARPTGSDRGRVDLADALGETRFLFEKNLRVAGVEVKIKRETDPWVYGNRNELEQVFFNLMANALDAMPDGGGITVTIAAGDPGELTVVFSDTGEGIPEEHRDSIFLPFFTTKDYGMGTGLGLSIVARIVHEHGGRIAVDSVAGSGTTFCLHLPRARGESGSPSLIEDG